ncbi:MAG: SDR family oxidoreductase [Saprospiraceae bacterium]
MKVFLLGATGKTGEEILKNLLKEGHQVKILVRDPSKLNPDDFAGNADGKLEVAKGGIFDLESLKSQMKGSDLVISSLGTGTSNTYTAVYSEGGRNILNAMRELGIDRLTTITSGLIDMSDPSTDNFFLNRIIRPNYNKVYYDQTRWETILDDTKDIKWTCVRPSYLSDGKATGKYRVQLNHCPQGGRKISRKDLADFIVNQMNSEEYVFQKPVLAY